VANQGVQGASQTLDMKWGPERKKESIHRAPHPTETAPPHHNVPFQGGDEADANEEGVEARRLPVLGPSPWQISASRSRSMHARNVDEASSTSVWVGSRRVVVAIGGAGGRSEAEVVGQVDLPTPTRE